ncbi:MAG TPA: AAA family ATPase [Kiloniellales bacterium]|nr:AAA family ATPase [Kiloniellales bacterium]
MPRLVVLAGPNGAGKTTFAKQMFTAEISAGSYLNADEEAATLNPASVDQVALQAARNLLARRREFIAAGRDLIVETTLAGRSFLREVNRAQRVGYRVELHYLFVPTVELCMERVLFRVQRGGHGIPSAVITRRYARSLALLPSFLASADSYALWDVSADPKLFARKSGDGVSVLDDVVWLSLAAKMKIHAQAL